MAINCVSGSPVNGSFPFVGGDPADGGGLTKVTPSTVGVTEGLASGVDEVVGEVLAGQLLGVASGKVRNAFVGDALARGSSGIGGAGAGLTPGLAVIVTTMVSDTWVPCAQAAVPNLIVAAPAVAVLIMNAVIKASTLEVCCTPARRGTYSARC